MEALSVGAVDYVAKPSNQTAGQIEAYGEEIISKVKAAASARVAVQRRERETPAVALEKQTWDQSRLIAIGASTGGTEAIRNLLAGISADCPPIVITQHIPAEFSESFANRLDRQCPMQVLHAQDGMPIKPGCAYVAPGSHHLLISGRNQSLTCKLSDAEPVNRHRPVLT